MFWTFTKTHLLDNIVNGVKCLLPAGGVIPSEVFPQDLLQLLRVDQLLVRALLQQRLRDVARQQSVQDAAGLVGREGLLKWNEMKWELETF